MSCLLSVTRLLLDESPNTHIFLPRYPHKIHPALPSPDINCSIWFGDFLLQELLTACVANDKGAFGWGFDGDGGGCRVGVKIQHIGGWIVVINSDGVTPIIGFYDNTDGSCSAPII